MILCGIFFFFLDITTCLIWLSLSRHMWPAHSGLFETRYFRIFVPLKILSIFALVWYLTGIVLELLDIFYKNIKITKILQWYNIPAVYFTKWDDFLTTRVRYRFTIRSVSTKDEIPPYSTIRHKSSQLSSKLRGWVEI